MIPCPEAVQADRIAEWKRLTEVVLPALARAHRWPLRLDHCFKRVTLDHAFGDVWYRHISKPAERNLRGHALDRALSCAQAIANEGEALLRLRNQESLAWRQRTRV